MAGALAGALLRPGAALLGEAAPGGEGPVTTPRLPAREAAEHELSRPEYHEHDPGLLQRALDWLWEHLGSLLSTAAGAAPGGWLGIVTIVAVVLLLLVALRLRLGKLRTAPARTTTSLFSSGPRSAAQHREAAEAHAAAGRWSDAVQERMRALVRSLEERTVLDARPGRTADEAAHHAGRLLPAHTAELRAAARLFDEVTYADRPADAAAYQRLSTLDQALEQTTPHFAQDPAPAAAASGARS